MDPQTALAMFNLFRNSPALIDAAIVWLQASKTFVEAVNAAQTATPAP
jgi:hypothetical protein